MDRAAFDFLRKGRLRPRTLAFLLPQLTPAQLDHVPVAEWERFSPPPGLPPAVVSGGRAFLLAVGLRRGDEGRRLVLRHFAPVHHAVSLARLEPRHWGALAAELPDLGQWRRWDRCESLRRGLVERASRHRWSPAEILAAVRAPELFSFFLATCAGTSEGRALAERLRGYAKRPRAATQQQRRALASLARETAAA